jgi:hypothetical protein
MAVYMSRTKHLQISHKDSPFKSQWMISTHKPSTDPLLQNSRLLIDAIWPQFQEYVPNYITKLL